MSQAKAASNQADLAALSDQDLSENTSSDHLFDTSILAPTAPDLTLRSPPDSDIKKHLVKPTNTIHLPSLSLDLGPTGLSVTFDDLRNTPSPAPPPLPESDQEPHLETSQTDDNLTTEREQHQQQQISRRLATLTDFGRSILGGTEHKTHSFYHKPTLTGSATNLRRRISELKLAVPSTASQHRPKSHLFKNWTHRTRHTDAAHQATSSSISQTSRHRPPIPTSFSTSKHDESAPELGEITSSPALTGIISDVSAGQLPFTLPQEFGQERPILTSVDPTTDPITAPATESTLEPPPRLTTESLDQKHERAPSLMSSMSQPILPSQTLLQTLLPHDQEENQPPLPHRSSMTETGNVTTPEKNDSEHPHRFSWRRPTSFIRQMVKRIR